MNSPVHDCELRDLLADKATTIWRTLAARDPCFVLESMPGGARCWFIDGNSIFVSECLFCAFDEVCSLDEKSERHH